MGVTAKISRMNKKSMEQSSLCRSFTRTVVSPGSGLVRPNEGSTCTVQISQSGDLRHLDEAVIGYPLGVEAVICLGDGEGPMSRVVDTCLEMMLPGETCKMEVAMEAVREITQRMQSQTPVNCEALLEQPVALQIDLKLLVRDKDIHEMTINDKLDRAAKFKAKGSSCFSCGNLPTAETFYLRALQYIITIDPLELDDESDATREAFGALKCACLLNVAACKLKYKCYEHVVTHCTRALEIDGGNPKGFFRRGIAYMELQEYEKARGDFDQALHFEPTSKPLKQQRLILQERMKNLDAKYAKAMSKMFGGQ